MTNADSTSTPDDLRGQLAEVEEEIERLRTEADEVVAQRKNAGTLDSEDIAASLTAQEETEALIATLEARRAGLQDRLDRG